MVVGAPRDDYPYDVFVSYSHADAADWVRQWLVPQLRHAGLKVCVDYDTFDAGIYPYLNMQNAVAHSRRTVVVMTPAWVSSEWTSFEGLTSLSLDPISIGQRTVPVLLQACDPPRFLSNLTYLDFTSPDRLTEQLKRLLDALQGRRRLPDADAPRRHDSARTASEPRPDPVPPPDPTAHLPSAPPPWHATPLGQLANESVDRAMGSLFELLRTPSSQIALEGILVNLTSVREHLSGAANHKKLHDLLHELEVQSFTPLLRISRRPLDDDAVDETLIPAHVAMESVVDELRSVLEGGAASASDARWINGLIRAEALLSEAREEMSDTKLASVVSELRSTLSRVPARINQAMVTEARGVRLAVLEERLGPIIRVTEHVGRPTLGREIAQERAGTA